MTKKIKKLRQDILSGNLFIFLLAVLSALALTADLDVAVAAEAGIKIGLYQQIYKLIEIIGQGIKDQGFILSILTILFSVAYWLVWKKKEIKPVKYSKGLALFLSVMYVAGMGYAYADTVTVLVTSSIRLLRTIICICGFWILYLTAINVLYDFIKSGWDAKAPNWKALNVYQRHPFAFPWVIIMGVWLIHLILRYPGTMSYDNARQLSYYFGYDTFTTAQPIFHTVLFSFFVQIGLWLGNENLGLFLFVMMQSLVMSGVLAYSLYLMKQWNAPRWLRMLTLGIYIIAPYYTGYASFPIKDFLYTAFFVLILMYSFEWFRDSDALFGTKVKQIGFMVAASMLILVRNNGIYVYLPLALFILFSEIARIKKTGDGKWKRAGIVLLVLLGPLVISWGTKAFITEVWNVQKDTPKEMLSLPFQQTARYVRDYGDELTEEERATIDAVLDCDKIAEVYMELTADPVKSTFHAQNTAEVMEYFKVWFRQFLKHPLCYLEATWNQNYYLFAPNIDNIVYNKDCTVAYETINELNMQELITFKVPEKMHGICTIMVSFYALLTRLPIIGLLNNVAFYMILLFVMTCFFLKDGQKKAVWTLMPLWLTFLIIIASPQIQNQPRYAFPIIYSMPIVVAFFMKNSGCNRDRER